MIYRTGSSRRGRKLSGFKEARSSLQRGRRNPRFSEKPNPRDHSREWQELGTASSGPCDFIRAEGAWPWNSTIEEGRVRGTGSDILPLLSNNPDITPTNTKIPFLRETRKRTRALDSDGTGLNPGSAIYSFCELCSSPCLVF